MRKFTLLIASLFITIGAMAQPQVGKYYKIKGNHSTNPWLTAVVEGGGIDVASNEANAGIYEITTTGIREVFTGKYIGTGGNGSQITLVSTADATTIETSDNGKYLIKTGGRYLYNNQADYTREAGNLTAAGANDPKWEFIEVAPIFTMNNEYNGRGTLCFGKYNGNECFALTGITLDGYTGNSVTVENDADKYWYVKRSGTNLYIYNIGKGMFLQAYSSKTAMCGTGVANGFTVEIRTQSDINYRSFKSGDYYLTFSCGWGPAQTGDGATGQVRWINNNEEAATLLTVTPVEGSSTTYASEIAKADALINGFENPYTLNVTDAGYATLYLGYPAEIPTFEGEENGVYIATGMSTPGYINLQPVTGVLPANTGVIVKANSGNYEFVYSAETASNVSSNLLKGSVANEYVAGAAYVLSAPAGANSVGLYPAILNKNAEGNEGTTHFINNANKAYLPNSTGSNVASYSFRFGEGTTGVEKVEIGNEKSEIYDLTDRRVEEITEPGIYIVNGVKKLVK